MDVGNYVSVLKADGLATSFVNSLVVTIPAVVIPITMAAFAAYAFAWMRFPGRACCSRWSWRCWSCRSRCR